MSVVLAAALFAFALVTPFVTLRALGRATHSTLLTGPHMLARHGLPGLASVVFLTLVLMPAAKLAVQLVVLFASLRRTPSPRLAWTYAWLDRLAPWAMVEVFLLGAFVAYTRLRALAYVEVGPAILALGGAMLAMVAIDATLDREALWDAIDPREPPPSSCATARGDAKLVGCPTCGRVARACPGDRCTRCRHPIAHRKVNSVARVWALLAASVLLYVPANVLPVMTVERFGRGGPTTIMNGVSELFEAKMWPLAILVLLASIIVPMLKLVSLALMLVGIHLRSGRYLRQRTRLFRFVHSIGRWSMIDIFMLATLVGVVQLGLLATILPGMGAGAFCAVVLLTMVATEMFDPRLMWDAAGRAGDALVREDPVKS